MSSTKESFQKITIKMLSRIENLERKDKEGLIVYVTSADKGEGKSYVASCLAQNSALATANKVLLVDANMDAPVIHKQYKLDNEQGLSDAIISQEWPSIKIQKSSVTNLFYLTAGSQCKSGLLFKKHVVQDFVSYIRKNFDLIIIDSASIRSSGTNSLVSLVDGIVIVIDTTSTRKQVIQYALDELNVGKEKIIGALLNKKIHYIPKFIYELF